MGGAERRAGAFVLDRRLGAGAMGSVWASRHVPTGTPVAVKLLFGLKPNALIMMSVPMKTDTRITATASERLVKKSPMTPETSNITTPTQKAVCSGQLAIVTTR